MSDAAGWEYEKDEDTTEGTAPLGQVQRLVMPDFKEVKAEILANLDHSRFYPGMYDSDTKLSFGDFVISGINTLGTNVIGYVVQIRRRWGAFGSDMFFIRERYGGLMTHENQSFWKLTKEQTKSVLPFFKDLPCDEIDDNPKLEYSVLNDQYASGFIVGKKDAPERVDSCSFAITVSKA